MTPPAGLANPADFAGALAEYHASNSLRERADAIHKAGLGSVLTYADAKETPVKELTRRCLLEGSLKTRAAKLAEGRSRE